MNLFVIIGEALRALRLNRLRTGLTMLGMIIGGAYAIDWSGRSDQHQ